MIIVNTGAALFTSRFTSTEEPWGIAKARTRWPGHRRNGGVHRWSLKCLAVIASVRVVLGRFCFDGAKGQQRRLSWILLPNLLGGIIHYHADAKEADTNQHFRTRRCSVRVLFLISPTTTNGRIRGHALSDHRDQRLWPIEWTAKMGMQDTCAGSSLGAKGWISIPDH